MNRSNPYRSPNRSSFNSRRGASRPQSRRHSSRNEEDYVSRGNPRETTNRFGSSQSGGQRFESDYRRPYEEDRFHDQFGSASYYQGDDDPAEGRRTSETSREDYYRYSSEHDDDPVEGRRDFEPSRPSHDERFENNRYSQWNRPEPISNGRHFDRQNRSFEHYDDPRNSSSRYSPMEDDRWQDDLDLDHAYEYRVEDHEDNERVRRRGSMNRYDDRSAHNRSGYSNNDQNYARHNRSENRRSSSRRRRNGFYHS